MLIRLLEIGHRNAFFNMALDEILMQNLGPMPILKFYGWNPPAVSVGYFQNVQEEVDLPKALQMNVDVVRRITGGGAVFHDKEITYSFITRSYPINIIESYKWISGGILRGLKKLGSEASFAPINDIVINGKKISGNAQTRKNGVLLQHGTTLLHVDVDKMFTLLKVPSEKMKDKIVQDVKQRVTALNVSFEEANQALKEGFKEALNAEFILSKLTEKEIAEAEKLAKEKYASKEWMFLH